MKKCRKLFTLLLALALCLGLAAPAFAAEGEPERGVLTYTEHITPRFEDAGRFSEGLAPVKQNGKWGYINEEGDVVIDFQYDRAYTFNEGYAVVGTITGPGKEEWDRDATYIQMGFVDKSGSYQPFLQASVTTSMTPGIWRNATASTTSPSPEPANHFYHTYRK